MKNLYLSEIRKELANYSSHTKDITKNVITEDDIAPLPGPVRKYFQYCGYIGREKMINAEIAWEDFYLKLSPGKEWVSVESNQFNSVPVPVRIAYMKAKIARVLPFEGRDKYQDGHGNMLIKLLKILKVADAKGEEMDQSGLVTVLAESFLVPTYLLQHYIKLTEVNSNVVKAEISHNVSRAGGLFYFNDFGEFIRFETDDRYYTEKGGNYKKVKWSATVVDYKEKNGIKFPSCLKGTWHTGEKDFDYFKGKISRVKFNINPF